MVSYTRDSTSIETWHCVEFSRGVSSQYVNLTSGLWLDYFLKELDCELLSKDNLSSKDLSITLLKL